MKRPKRSNSPDRSFSREIKELPTESLAVDPMNIRKEPKLDDEFMESIKKDVIEPLVVRPVDCIEDKKTQEELRSKGRQFVVTAGVRRFEAAFRAELKTVPCIVRNLNDVEATALSIAENRHRKDIPAHRWAEIIRDLYEKLKGTKDERAKKISGITGVGYSTIYEYLLLADLPGDFIARLKEPEERSFSEKQALTKTSVPRSEETAPFDESGKETPPFEPPQVPEQVMVKLARDEDFKRLTKKNPAKAHGIATKAAEKGQMHVGEVLRTIREHQKAEIPPRPPTAPPVNITARLGFSWDELDALERYRQMQGVPDLPAAACTGAHEWIVQKSGKKWMDLEVALRCIVIETFEGKRCLKTEGR
ncbi:MAG: ParB/RepB/Spo0J family partition protein [Methanobacteriota archaeon]